MSRDDDERFEERYQEEDSELRSEIMPHRGGMVMTFGIISVVTGALSFLMCFPALVGLPLGILAWIWGKKDLRAMNEGWMDSEGRGNTHAGFICGIIGTVLCGLVVVGFVAYMAVLLIMMAVASMK